MALWGGRFTSGSSSMFKQVNDSLPFDQVMASQDIHGSIIWSRALNKAGVLTDDEQAQLEAVLSSLKQQAEEGTLDFASSAEEDIHSFVEAALIEQLGDIGRKLHTGRSRNDQVATDFRLWVREHIESLREDIIGVIRSLLSAASRHQEAIIPGYTHLQRAQPIHFAHWCLAYVEMFKRDLSRLDDAKKRLNQCPLGSGALAGTTYPVDRDAIAEALGFTSPCLNSLDAVSDRDFVLELLFTASTSMMHLSRLAEDMIFYNSGEAGFLQLGDSVTSGSSLMPQKKNPDALELMRGKCGRVFGSLQGLLVTMKGLPLAYNKDMQEDKEGAIDTVNQWHICLCIASEVLDSLQLNEARCREAATQGYANATELADYLVGKGIPFRTGHDISGQVVVHALEKGCAIEDLPLEDLQSICDKIEDDVYPVLQLEFGVNQRNILGGTSKETVTKALYQELEALDKLS
ncbi:argininosuccinate lyase [Alteromonas sp. KUL49]|uniref:argininosuccinate lyase n=1 Tax=Alteromonas sp. KUL49 TaxID=2480798 RepID=UPI00102EECB5|nr:argininosuccinate lyase [Alteromonas sp. KUL49]TAP42537.1 argininosuccinate lyase [Alteromonas sp. KUL49]GEA10166.1 argininosuccinate lyase [Alteromonas sp. KUL49]